MKIYFVYASVHVCGEAHVYVRYRGQKRTTNLILGIAVYLL